jgi:tetratricopeptide (TPR) repeat protein
MVEIVNGLVDGLPEHVARTLVQQSEGIPLYALEMVRGLIDRDVVIPHEGRYVIAPDVEQGLDLSALDAPPSLQALIGARLDALAPAERQLVQDASVHGLAFSRDGIGFVSDVADLQAVLDELVRKEIFELHSDRFSTERGQYRFLQALVRTVAYDTLSRRDRKARHLAVAEYLEQTSQGDEVAAVIARHYIDALDSGPDDADASRLVSLALDHLERAGRRAEALGSPDEALRHYTTALARQPDLADRVRVLEGAARAAASSARAEEAIGYAEEARTAYETLGRPIDAGRIVAIHGDALSYLGQYETSIELLGPVYERLMRVPDAGEAILLVAENLARAHTNIGQPVEAQPYADHALQLAEARQDWERVVALLGRHAVIWVLTGRPTGSLALLRAAVDLGRRHHLPRAMITPLLNTSAFLKNHELEPALAAGREAIDLATKVGALDRRTIAASNIALVCWVSGDWDEALALDAQYGDELGAGIDTLIVRVVATFIRDARGEPSDLDVDLVEISGYTAGDYIKPLAAGVRAAQHGDPGAAAAAFAAAIDSAHQASGLDDDFAIVWPFAVEAALASGRVDEAQRFLAYVADAPRGLVTPLVHAHLPRLRALVGIAAGTDDVDIDVDLDAAITELRDFGARFYLGRALLELARRRSERGDDEGAAPLFDEARAVFLELRAERWVAETLLLSSPR